VHIDSKNVLKYQDTVVGAPHKPTTKEGKDEEEAVDKLVYRPSEIEFVAEPVDIEERTREFKENEDGGVIINKRSLHAHKDNQCGFCRGCQGGGTNPKLYTTNAENACAIKPGPVIST